MAIHCALTDELSGNLHHVYCARECFSTCLVLRQMMVLDFIL
jgi:hypothetical protein